MLNLWGSLASIAIVVSYIPQLKQTFMTKNVEGQNIKFWILLTFSATYFFINALLSKDIVNIVAQLFNLVGASSMLIMVYKYKDRSSTGGLTLDDLLNEIVEDYFSEETIEYGLGLQDVIDNVCDKYKEDIKEW